MCSSAPTELLARSKQQQQWINGTTTAIAALAAKKDKQPVTRCAFTLCHKVQKNQDLKILYDKQSTLESLRRWTSISPRLLRCLRIVSARNFVQLKTLCWKIAPSNGQAVQLIAISPQQVLLQLSRLFFVVCVHLVGGRCLFVVCGHKWVWQRMNSVFSTLLLNNCAIACTINHAARGVHVST